jgi:CrcB protein
VNISGSFVIGVLFTVLTERWLAPPWIRSTLMIGLLGAYTTFSTLSLESYRLFEDRAYGVAAANLFGSLAAGLVAVYAGVVVGRAL